MVRFHQLATFTDEGFDSHISSIINKEWLDNLGLSIPTNTDELYSVLKAFKENYPDSYPWVSFIRKVTIQTES